VSWWFRLIGPLRTVLDEYFVAPLARIFRTAGAREDHPLTVEELDELLIASQSVEPSMRLNSGSFAEVVGPWKQCVCGAMS